MAFIVGHFPGPLRHMRRYREVIKVLGRYGFGYVLDQLGLLKIRSEHEPADALTAPARVRMVLEELGPTYIKLGQLLSTRPDLIPVAYLNEFERLQDNVPPVGCEEMLKVLDSSNILIERDFSWFDPVSIASASIGQVHQAILNTGEKVAVKIQRPGVQKMIEKDLEILFDLARVAERRTTWGRLYQVVGIVQEFADALTAELDFAREGRNADRFRQDFAGDPNVIIPKVFWPFTSRKVLVLEYVEGIKVSNAAALRASGENVTKVAQNIVDSLFVQIYENGFFHADPHPGNLAVASGARIIYYDFGQVGVLDNLLKERGMDLVLAMVRYDVNGVTRALLDIGIATQHVDREEFRREVSKLQRKYYGVPLVNIDVGKALTELIELTFKHRVRIPPELSLMVKMLITIESLVSQLDPELSLVKIAEPFGRRILRKRYAPSRLMDRLRDMVIDYAAVARNVPREIDSVLTMLEEGELKVKIEHIYNRELVSKADVISNRLSVAIVIASLIMGTAFISDRMTNTVFGRVPLAEVGFVLAFILGLTLVYSILRSGRY